MSRLQSSSSLIASVRHFGVAAGIAAVLALGAVGSASAFGGPGMRGAGPGMMGEGFGPQMVEAVKSKLNLDSSQLQRYDAIVAQARATREAARTEMLATRDRIRAELTKAQPDLAAAAAIADEAQAKHQATRKAIRGEWLALYTTFTDSQKAVIREFIANRMARADGFRQKMRERGPFAR